MITNTDDQRIKLQNALFKAVREFEDSTDHVVERIDLSKASIHGSHQTIKVFVFTGPKVPGLK